MGDNGPVRFLSREWLDHMTAAAAAASPPVTVSIHQRVTGGPEGDVEYTVRVVDGRVTFEPGPGPADVELVSDYETAAAISQGRLSAGAAFAAGRLRARGSVSSLVAHREALSTIGTAVAATAELTTY